MTTSVANDPIQPSARDRILDAAYTLFAARGVRDVGVDELISRSGVAKATFYRHFPSKDDLVLDVLERREREWTLGLIVAQARERGSTPRAQLLAIFDVFDDWFRRSDYEACTFINVLLEMGASHPLGQASIGYLNNIREMVRDLAEEAQLRDCDDFARAWQILMKGSIISAADGDLDAAHRAQDMAVWLIDHHSNRPHREQDDVRHPEPA
jgi:AcrR family transcriptional regulator